MSAATPDVVPAQRPMLHALAKAWWLVLLRGIAGILFGVLAFVRRTRFTRSEPLNAQVRFWSCKLVE